MNCENNLQQSIWGLLHLLQVLCFCSYSKILMNIANSYLFVIIMAEKREKKNPKFCNKTFRHCSVQPWGSWLKKFYFLFPHISKAFLLKNLRPQSWFIKLPATGSRLATPVEREFMLTQQLLSTAVWSTGEAGLLLNTAVQVRSASCCTSPSLATLSRGKELVQTG